MIKMNNAMDFSEKNTLTRNKQKIYKPITIIHKQKAMKS